MRNKHIPVRAGLLVTFMVFNAIAAPAPVVSPEAGIHEARGDEFVEKARGSDNPKLFYGQAIKEYDTAIYLDPKRRSAYRKIALCHESMQGWKTAVEYHRKSIELSTNPNERLNGLRSIALCHQQAHDYQAEERVWLEALESFPDYSFIYVNLARVSLGSGDVARFEAYHDKALDILERNRATNQLTQAQYEADRRSLDIHWNMGCRQAFGPRSPRCRRGIEAPPNPQDPELMWRKRLENATDSLAKGTSGAATAICSAIEGAICWLHGRGNYSAVVSQYEDASKRFPCALYRERSIGASFAALTDSLKRLKKWDDVLFIMEKSADSRYWSEDDRNQFSPKGEIRDSVPLIQEYLSSRRAGLYADIAKARRLRTTKRWVILLGADQIASLAVKGNPSAIPAGRFRVGTDNRSPGAEESYRLFLKFDLRDIPNGVSVQEAFLVTPYGSDSTLTCHRVLGTWRPADGGAIRFGEGFELISGRFGLGYSQAKHDYVYRSGEGTFDITPLATDWLKDPAANHGLLIKEMSEDNRRRRSPQTAALPPKLFLLVSAEQRPIPKDLDVLDCRDTWDSLYFLGMKSLREGDILSALHYWRESRDMLTEVDVGKARRWVKYQMRGQIDTHTLLVERYLKSYHPGALTSYETH